MWDDAEELIALNQRLRAEIAEWPPWLFALGQAEGDPSGYVIDTRTADCPVWWLEQMRLGPSSGPGQGPFDAWFASWVAEAAPSDESDKSVLWFLGAWLLLSAVGVLLMWILAMGR